MRKHFLLVFLLAVLPLVGWATKPVGTAPTAATSLVYNGSPQALLSAPAQFPAGYETGSGQILYIALEGTGTPLKSNSGWSTSIPTATDAKTYHVWYYITNDGTSNFNEDGDIKQVGTGITIGKKPIATSDFTLPTAISGLVFTNADQDIFEPATWTGETLGKFQYRLRQGSLSNPSSYGGWSSVGDAIPQGFNAVSYQVEVSVTDVDPNYQWTLTNQRASNSMARATWVEGENYTAPTQKADAIFNNTNQNYLTPGTNTLGATMQYSTSTNYWATWRNTVDHNDFRATNVAQNPITRYYRIQGGNGYNWNSLNATAIQANILPADAPDATGGALKASPLPYTGANQPLVETAYSVTLLSGTATVRYYVDGADKGTNISGVTAKDQGEYEITYTLDYNNAQTRRNYKPVDPAKVLGTVKIDKRVLVAAAVGYSKDFDDKPFTADERAKLVDATGWLGTETDAQKAEILTKLIKVISGLPATNVGKYDVELESQEVDEVSYKIDPLFHATGELNILKINNSWKNDVSIAATWAYGSTPSVPSCEPALLKKENGEDAEITYKYYTDAACTTEYTGDIDETMPVGTYYVKAFVEGCNNFFELESVTPASFEITATDPAWTKPVAIEGWEYTKYDATANKPTAEVDDDAEITFKYYSDLACTTEITTDPATWTIGTYYVKAYAAATANHNAVENGPAEFKVTPTTLPELALTFAPVPYIEGGDNQIPTVTEVQALITEVPTTEYDVTFTDADDNVTSEFINVGTYYVVITGAANYAKLDDEGNINFQKVPFVIEPIDPEITAPIANKLTYTAEKQILAQEAISADGTFEYSLTGEDGSWDINVPTGLNAGEYTVYTKFTPDGNHNDATVDPITVKILPAQLEIKLTNNLEKTWDGLEFSPEQVEETYIITGLLGDDVYDVPFTLTLPVTEENNFIDAKVYELKKLNFEWKEGKGQNYKYGFTTEGSVTINKADIDATDYVAPVAVEDLVFNGEEQEIVTAGEITNEYEDAPIATILFAQGETAPAEDSADWTEDVPVQTNAGEYPVWFMVKGDDNHNNVAAAQLTGKIAPKEWTAVLAFEDAEVVYDGSDFMPADLSLNEGDLEVELEEGEDKDYTLTIQKDGEDVTEIINIGEYVFTYTGVGNYEGSVTTVTIKVAGAELDEEMFSEFEDELVYDMTDQKPTITLTYEGMTLEEDTDFELAITKDGEEFAADAEFINAGEYVLTYTGIGNYTGEISATINIAKRQVQAQAKDATKVYDGIAGLGETVVEFTFSNLVLGEAEDAITMGDAVYFEEEAKNVGKYKMLFDKEKFASDNYEVIGVETTPAHYFTITPAPLTVDWNDAAEGFTKTYGADDPELTATEDNLIIVGAVDADVEDIIAQTVITRAEGEAVGKYAITLSADEDADPSVFANYDVTFGDAADVFVIEKADLIVSIAPIVKTYDGETITEFEATADQLIITDLKGGDAKADIFTTLPTVKVTGEGAKDAGDYELTLSGAVAADYDISYLPSTLTIDPMIVLGEFTTIPVVAVGAKVDEVLAQVKWNVVVDEEAGQEDAKQEVIDAELNDVFELTFTGDVDEAGLIASTGYFVIENSSDNFVLDEESAIAKPDFGGAIVSLDDSAPVVTFESEDGTTVKFTNSRAVPENTWQACVLPCTVSIEDFSNAFGYAAVDVLDQEKTTGDEIHFSLKVSGNIEAGVPFLFKSNLDRDFANAEIKNATMANTADLTPVVEDDDTDVKFIGTFETVNLTTAGYRYMSKGKWYATQDGKAKPYVIKPLRAYLDLGTAAGARIFIEEPNGTTAIMSVETFNEGMTAEGWYTVDGKKLNAAPTQKGVYINNGQKVVVK